ncbi:TraR/DksA family transcriptional regulator [Neisseria dentiae]|uniref:TraR/DksA family transcriptional regulator n=1 Tax=Neisseria dentiae TaxID=194197 RepID=UPI00359FFB54
MPDIFDRDAELEERQRAYWLQRQKEKTEYAPPAFECEECGDPIPEARRQAVPACRTCIACQQEIEQYGKTCFTP